MKKVLFSLLMSVLFMMGFVSCTAEATLELKADGKVVISFLGGTGEAFSKMISAAVGESDGTVFDTREISYELAKSGFTKVKANSSGKTDISITMEDEKQKSFLFTSGVAKVNGNQLELNLTKESVVKFYQQADEQIVSILDLLLAPVFNDEQMSADEYLETVGAFYGDGAAKELGGSVLKVTLISAAGKKQINIPFTEILTL